MSNEEKLALITDALINVFKKDLTKPIQPTDSLVDLGLDSLDIVEMQMYYEDTTGHDLPVNSLLITVKDLMDIMK